MLTEPFLGVFWIRQDCLRYKARAEELPGLVKRRKKINDKTEVIKADIPTWGPALDLDVA